MFPAGLRTDRLAFERYSRENVEPRTLYKHLSDRNPTVESEFEYLPWNAVDTVGGAADRIETFEDQWAERERAE